MSIFLSCNLKSESTILMLVQQMIQNVRPKTLQFSWPFCYGLKIAAEARGKGVHREKWKQKK